MKKFEEIKKNATELKDKTVTFCKEHKEGIKNAAIFVGGLGLSYVLTKDYYTPRDGDDTKTDVIRFKKDGAIGYITKTYNKHGKERKQIREVVSFNSPDVAMRIGQNLIMAAHDSMNSHGRYIWDPEQVKEKMEDETPFGESLIV